MSNKKIIFILGVIYIVAILLRVWFVKDGSLIFGFDQARDAVYAQEILAGDLKIFGPTASGTNDSIFHGVLYYYFLAGLHLLTQDPVQVTILLGAVSALSIFPTFLLAKSVSKNNLLSLGAALLAAVSFEQITAGTWLSNPALGILTLPWFFYFSYRLAHQFNAKWMIGMMLFLGLSTQAIFFEVYWLLVPLFIFVTQLKENKWQFKWSQLKVWFLGGMVFLASISSMVLAELVMIKRGILNLEILSSFNTGAAESPFQLLNQVLALYVNKVSFSLSPRLGLLFFLLLVVYLGVVKVKRKSKFLWLLLTVPVFFLLIYYRNSPHILLSYEVLLYAVGALVMNEIFLNLEVKWVKNVSLILMMIVFLGLNLGGLAKIKVNHNHPNSIQKEFLYADQELLIAKTYQLAKGEPFSIATLTNPYGVNVTWGYLYDYLGNRDHGYEPTYFGFDQTGWVGADLLVRVEEPARKHFAILEPDTGLDNFFVKKFLDEQQVFAGTPSASYNFGSLELLEY